MATMTAKTKQDVDQLSARDRVWDSLNYSYGQKKENAAKEYGNAISQQNNAFLKRGMQRSSYAGSVLGNMRLAQAKAMGDIDSEMIADYENRLYQIERDEKSDEQWERSFGENQRQFNENMAYNRERAAASDEQWAQQFGYQKERDAVADDQWSQTFGYQKERDAVSDEQWNKSFDQSVTDSDRTYYYNWATALLAKGEMPSKDILAKAGLTKADAKKLKGTAAVAGGGGGKTGKKADTEGEEEPATSDAGLFGNINSFSGTQNTTQNTTQSSIGNRILNNVNNTKKKNQKTVTQGTGSHG